MSEDEENFSTQQHQKLLAEINDIVNTQHIKKPKRSEASIQHTEFHLVKNSSIKDQQSNQNRVSISRLTETIKKNTKQKQIAKQLLNAFKGEHTLPKPIPKIHAERIQRIIAYDNAKIKLNRWDAIVERNKVADQLVFPLDTDKVDVVNQKRNYNNYRIKSELMKSLEKLEEERNPIKVLQNEFESEDGGTLTVEEMKARRKELAKIRTREGFKISKTRLQSKIKSKTYHKLKKREKVKQKIKDFEALKANDPEAALKELNKIEKQRMEERAGLRHKNTGTWAKNLQVRAKYDMNVKQDLEDQLALSRELTLKQNVDESSESENEEVNFSKHYKNPWLSENTENKEDINNIFSGYKKFWEEHNDNQKALTVFNNERVPIVNPSKDPKILVGSNYKIASNTKLFSKWIVEDNVQSEEEININEDDCNQESFLNDLFDKAEEKMITAVNSKFKQLETRLDISNKNGVLKMKKGTSKKNRFDVNTSGYLGFKKKAKLTDIDDELVENEYPENIEDMSNIHNVKYKQNGCTISAVKDINLDSFLNVKTKHLITALPEAEIDEIYYEEGEKVKNMNKISLAEAFEYDDVVDFVDEEMETIGNSKINTLSSQLPGWGSWGGVGVKIKKQNFLKIIPKQGQKDRIIVNNSSNDKIKKHLVSTIPFPFTSVEAFEASIRNPIGRSFVPETVHNALVLPVMVTKIGKIIEPMTEEVLNQKHETSNLQQKGNGKITFPPRKNKKF